MGEKVDGGSGGMDTANEQLGERGESGTSQWIEEVGQLNYNTHGLNSTPQLVETEGRKKKGEEKRRERREREGREREKEREGGTCEKGTQYIGKYSR